MLEQERWHASQMQAIARQQYQEELDFQQEMQRKQAALPFSEYDPNNEYYYYYDERGDYLDTYEARDRWQRENCKSYKTYDPENDFWKYYHDANGQLIDRQTAFEMWQKENCPDYNNYQERGFWTIYRCRDEFIPADETRKKWIEENPDDRKVKLAIEGDTTEEIKKVYLNGVAELPKNINEKTVRPYPESMDKAHPMKQKYNSENKKA